MGFLSSSFFSMLILLSSFFVYSFDQIETGRATNQSHVNQKQVFTVSPVYSLHFIPLDTVEITFHHS